MDREEDGEAEGGSSSTNVLPDPPISGSTFSLSPLSDPDCDYDGDAKFSLGQGEEDDILSRDQLHVDWAWIAAARMIIEPELLSMNQTLRAQAILGGYPRALHQDSRSRLQYGRRKMTMAPMARRVGSIGMARDGTGRG